MDFQHFMETFIQSSFSVAVAAFLLLRIEKELKHLARAINQLRLCQVCKNKPVRGEEIL